MNTKQIILFILLTTILVVLSYLLLAILDKHAGIWLAVLLGILVVADIRWMAHLLQRIMRSNSSHR